VRALVQVAYELDNYGVVWGTSELSKGHLTSAAWDDLSDGPSSRRTVWWCHVSTDRD
jgi:hypothetical protein